MYIEENNDARNIVLAGFFGAHIRGKATECDGINSESGIYLIEAMRYAINNINKDNTTLLGFKMGYLIFDTCRSATRLQRQLLDVMRCESCVGAVGPPTSDEAMLASMFLGTHGLSQISYSATSVDLQDKQRYSSFYRTVPADDIQSRVLLDILKRYNWKYISTVNSYGNYGQRGMDRLISMLSKEGICISKRIILPKSPSEIDVKQAIEDLKWDRNARTVVLFTNSRDTITLLRSAGTSSKFQWLSSSAWKANMETVRGAQEAAKGAILLAYDGTNNERFMRYFKDLTFNDNSYRWFREFWEKQFDCALGIAENSAKKLCSGNESLSESNFYAKFEAAGAVIDAVNVYARLARCVIENYLFDSCESPTCLKKGKPIPEWFSSYVTYYFQPSILPALCNDILKDPLKFDANHSYYRDIAILNFNGTTYKKVGVWKLNPTIQHGTLNISDKSIVWYHGLSKPPESICTKPCKSGEKKIRSKLMECCFICKACGKAEILRKNNCIACQKFSIPNKNKTSCRKLGKMRIEVTHPWSIIIIVMSTLGFMLNTIVLSLFIKHKESKIVKASSRELSFFILAGLYLCFTSSCMHILDPTELRCALRRFIFGVSFTACYTPLMLKTNRIYRIFKAAHVMVSMPQFVSPSSQIMICFGLIVMQMLLWITWVTVQPPVVNQFVFSNKVVSSCSTNILTIIVSIIPCFSMMAVSTVYAFKSRKFPKNYNEASSIGVTMYISFLLWTIFIPLLFLVNHKSHGPFAQVFVISNFSNLIGLVTLIGLFGPKVRRLFMNEDTSNAQRFFSTARREKPEDILSLSERKCDVGEEIGGCEKQRHAKDESTQIRFCVSRKTTAKTDSLRRRSMPF